MIASKVVLFHVWLVESAVFFRGSEGLTVIPAVSAEEMTSLISGPIVTRSAEQLHCLARRGRRSKAKSNHFTRPVVKRVGPRKSRKSGANDAAGSKSPAGKSKVKAKGYHTEKTESTQESMEAEEELPSEESTMAQLDVLSNCSLAPGSHLERRLWINHDPLINSTVFRSLPRE
ncbi:hypothetical protein DSO57_1025360 [Entomophthora muscae]|uniref:Uncharacterized protein n=2 Tax=Entomophthora muscae TaxID=34485 RepID=A0ACC2RM35_9FUNG|nr:hypothetical protein DSO57_1007782 [Entomophthora muscae]KAJ9072634.1 hypothetical protein DSO57_1025360 [Entomophthora muscae]